MNIAPSTRAADATRDSTRLEGATEAMRAGRGGGARPCPSLSSAARRRHKARDLNQSKRYHRRQRSRRNPRVAYTERSQTVIQHPRSQVRVVLGNCRHTCAGSTHMDRETNRILESEDSSLAPPPKNRAPQATCPIPLPAFYFNGDENHGFVLKNLLLKQGTGDTHTHCSRDAVRGR